MNKKIFGFLSDPLFGYPVLHEYDGTSGHLPSSYERALFVWMIAQRARANLRNAPFFRCWPGRVQLSCHGFVAERADDYCAAEVRGGRAKDHDEGAGGQGELPSTELTRAVDVVVWRITRRDDASPAMASALQPASHSAVVGGLTA